MVFEFHVQLIESNNDTSGFIGGYLVLQVDQCLKYMEQGRSSQGSSGNGKNKGGNRSNANNYGSRNNNWKGNHNKGGAGRTMSAAQHGYHKKLQSICALFNQGGCASPCPKGLKHICSKVTDNDSMRMCYSDQHPLIEHQ